MKLIIILLSLSFFQTANAQVLKNIQVFYHDRETTKGKDIYRELKQIGDDGVFAKPEMVDIVLNFNLSRVKSNDGINEQIQIVIEELYEPQSWVKKSRTDMYDGKGWVPHKVIYNGNTNLVKSDKIIVKDVPYQTAYFISSIQYIKAAFRFVAIYHNNATNKIETVKKEFNYE